MPPLVSITVSAMLFVGSGLVAIVLFRRVRKSLADRKWRKACGRVYTESNSDIIDFALRNQAEIDAESDNLAQFRKEWSVVISALRGQLHALPAYSETYTSARQEWTDPTVRETFLAAYQRPLSILLNRNQLRPVLRSAELVFEDGNEEVYPHLHTVTLCETGLKVVFYNDPRMSVEWWEEGVDVLRRALDAPDLTVVDDADDTLRIVLLLNDQGRRSIPVTAE